MLLLKRYFKKTSKFKALNQNTLKKQFIKDMYINITKTW